MARILLVEDDAVFADMLVDVLQREQHVVDWVAHGTSGSEKIICKNSYDLALLDWELPGAAGIDICMQARKQGVTMPIMIMTARTPLTDAEQGLDAGADDYLKKPFSMRELCARVSALLKRPATFNNCQLSCRNVILNLNTGEVLKAGKTVKLMPIDYALLEFFMRNQGQVFSVEQLLDHVWHADADPGPDAVLSSIKRLRCQLDGERDDSLIRTIYGFGFMLQD